MDIKTAVAIIGAIVSVGGALAWWFSRLLDDRKDSLKHDMEIKYLREDLQEMKQEMKQEIKEIKALINAKK